jgi:hypothetical protein
MDQDSKGQVNSGNIVEEEKMTTRRRFLVSLGKWSLAVIGGALLSGATSGADREAHAGRAWANRGGGGGAWANRGGGGGAWANRIGGGGAWVNGGGGAWVNRIYGGGVWANRGAAWINGGGAWINRF